MSEDIKRIFSSNLKEYMKINSENATKLSNSLNFSYSTVSDWINGNKMPRSKSLQILAEHYKLSTTDLLKQKNVRSNNEYHPSNNTKIIEKLITTQITDDQLDSILSFIDFTTRNNTGNGDSKKWKMYTPIQIIWLLKIF